jgi:tetratricopeptide (TPR) repeat protein
MRGLTHLFVLAAAICVAAGAARAVEPSQTATVLGTLNESLADGAAALDSGRIADGIRLTLEGLKLPAEPHDKAAGYSNLCAGYAILKLWDEALQHCNASLAIEKTNWRAFNNRAAVYSGKGEYQLALADLRAGLELAPKSRTLLESLRIVQENKRAIRMHGRGSMRPL